MRKFFPTALVLMQAILLWYANLATAQQELLFLPKQQYCFRYSKNNSEIGSERFTINETTYQGQKLLKLECQFKIGDDSSFQKGHSYYLFTRKQQPVKYFRYLHVHLPSRPQSNGKYQIEYLFSGGKAKGKITKDGKPLWQGAVPARNDLSDNNALALFALICGKWLKNGPKSQTVSTFNASTLRIIPVKFLRQGQQKIQIGARSYNANQYLVTMGNLTIGAFYVTQDGKFVKDVEPRQSLVIELVE